MLNGVFEPTDIQLVSCAEDSRVYLVDGQHRLWAIVIAERAVPLYIRHKSVKTFEEVAEIYARLDRGKSRSVLDVLHGYDLATEIGVPPTVLERLDNAPVFIETGFSYRTLHVAAQKSGDERVEMLRAWREEISRYWNAIQGATSAAARRKILAGPVAGVALVTVRFQPERALSFWKTVADNDGLRLGTPARTLVDYLLGHPIVTHTDRARAARGAALCWNAAYEGRALKTVRVLDDTGPFAIAGTPLKGTR